MPEGVIAYIDGYGNLKTTLRAEDRPSSPGTAVRIRIGAREHEALTGDGTFAVASGRMALAPGSSGWTSDKGRETRWAEVFLRGGNAWEAFGRPRIGDRVEVTIAGQLRSGINS